MGSACNSAANSPDHQLTQSSHSEDRTESSESSSSLTSSLGGDGNCNPTEYILGSPISSTTSNSQYEEDEYLVIENALEVGTNIFLYNFYSPSAKPTFLCQQPTKVKT